PAPPHDPIVRGRGRRRHHRSGRRQRAHEHRRAPGRRFARGPGDARRLNHAMLREMAAAATLPLAAPPAEQRMLLHVTWKEYVIMRDLLDGPALKMTYLRGALEIMSPSQQHELWKTNIARFFEYWAILKKVDLRGYGGTTFKKDVEERGC